MRDPKRIDRIVEKLRIAWRRHPDQRLGQFISNLIGPGAHDVFYPEDERWERLLDKALADGDRRDREALDSLRKGN